jgi:hypothetical protein
MHKHAKEPPVKLADMNPNTGLAHREVGRSLKVSTWQIIDGVDEASKCTYRRIFHHSTLMGEWYKFGEIEVTAPDEDDDFVIEADTEFHFAPMSTGRGSVSDQRGLNSMLQGTGWRFLRSGGVPRYVHENGRQFPH